MSLNIHPTAIVDPKAQLGEAVTIGPYCIVGPNVKLGDRCNLKSHVVMEGHTELGTDCEVFQFASIGARPQDLKYRGEPSTLIIGNRNTIRECATLQPGTAGGLMTTTIGDNNLFMAYSHIGHDSIIGSNNVFANSVAIAGHVIVESNVILGGLSGVHQFARIGSYSFLSGGAMVGQDIPPYCFAQGDRCLLRGINAIGLERSGFTAEQIASIRKAYRILFMGSGKMEERLSAVPADMRELPEIKRLLDFLAGSQRGITMPDRSPSAES